MTKNIGYLILCVLFAIMCTENKKLTNSTNEKLVGKWVFEKSVVKDSNKNVIRVFNSYFEMTRQAAPYIDDILEFNDNYVVKNYPTRINKGNKFTIVGSWKTKEDSIIIKWPQRYGAIPAK